MIRQKKSERKAIDETPSVITILGEPCSKANSRKVVMIRGHIRVIKSAKALTYVKVVHENTPVRTSLFDNDVFIAMKIFYKTRRPDLDESLILDVLQDRMYKNDRQVKGKYILWGLDNENPRTVVSCGPIGEKELVIRALEEQLKKESGDGDGDKC
jgi:Holliday junction resolvase RusA-like endonuclease